MYWFLQWVAANAVNLPSYFKTENVFLILLKILIRIY